MSGTMDEEADPLFPLIQPDNSSTIANEVKSHSCFAFAYPFWPVRTFNIISQKPIQKIGAMFPVLRDRGWYKRMFQKEGLFSLNNRHFFVISIFCGDNKLVICLNKGYYRFQRILAVKTLFIQRIYIYCKVIRARFFTAGQPAQNGTYLHKNPEMSFLSQAKLHNIRATASARR